MQPKAFQVYDYPDRDGAIWNGPHLLHRWLLFLIVLLIVVWFTPSSVGIVLCGGLALYALRGSRQMVEALALLALIIIMGKTDTSLGRWLVLFAAFGRVLWDSIFQGEPVPQLVYPLLVFSGTMVLFAILESQFPLVSILKVITFTLGVTVVATGFYRTRSLRDYWLSWLFTLGAFILLASVPLYGMGAGYTRNGAGFQGILSHPQIFGPVLASITALVMGLYLFRSRNAWSVLVLIGLGWVGMYFSLARTSILAVLLALSLTAVIGILFKSRTWGIDLRRAVSQPPVLVGMVLILLLGGMQWTTLQSEVSSFLSKDGQSDSIAQALEESRGSQIERSMDNFREKPLTGIGFGVPSDPSRFARHLERGPLGIPTSASVEKGFMPSAVLEETGIAGAILTIFFILYLFAPVIQQPDPTLFWVMSTCLFVNLGEMVFFSVGGVGFFFWIMMAFCHVAAIGLNEETPLPSFAVRYTTGG